MLTKLTSLAEGSMAALQLQVGTVQDGFLCLAIVGRGDAGSVLEFGFIELDLMTGEISGELNDPGAVVTGLLPAV